MTFCFNIIRNNVFESGYHFPVSLETNFSYNKNRNITAVANIVLMTLLHLLLLTLTHTAVDCILVDWQLSRKPQPVPGLMYCGSSWVYK